MKQPEAIIQATLEAVEQQVQEILEWPARHPGRPLQALSPMPLPLGYPA